MNASSLRTTSRTLFTLATAALLAAGCGGSGGGAASSSSTSAVSTPSTTNAPQFTDQQAPPSRVTLDVTIKGGEVTPTNQPLQGKIGEPIIIRVNSDAEDELHVHSVPDHEFKVEPKSGQQFQFTVDVPGKVDVELHHLDKTVATITVQ